MATTIRERITEFAAAQGFKTLSGFEKACGFSKKRENAQGCFVLQLGKNEFVRFAITSCME